MKQNNYSKTLFISMGDPAGISPYIFSKIDFQKIPEDDW